MIIGGVPGTSSTRHHLNLTDFQILGNMDLPKVVDPLWGLAKSNTVLDLQGLFLLRDDTPNYSGSHPPVAIMFNDKYHRIPKYLFPLGEAALHHLQTYQAPDLGRVTLVKWLQSIMESSDPISEDEEEEPTRDEEPPEDETVGEEVEQNEFKTAEETESVTSDPTGLNTNMPEEGVEADTEPTQAPTPRQSDIEEGECINVVPPIKLTRKHIKKNQRHIFLKHWCYSSKNIVAQ